MKTSSCLSSGSSLSCRGCLADGVEGPGNHDEHSAEGQHKQNGKQYCVSHVENHPFINENTQNVPSEGS
jgi:hypothetical protein